MPHLTDGDDDCHGCGGRGRSLGTQSRRLAHEPFGGRPTTLLVRVRRYRCDSCGRYWADDLRTAAQPRAKLSRGGLAWALRALIVDHLSMSRIAAGLGVAWHTANDAVRVIGVDEHVWRHTRQGDTYVTVVIDLTPVADGTGTSRLLDMMPGRSKQVFKTWLADRPPRWRDEIETVAMDGFTGFKTAATEELPDAVAVMDPFHVVHLAGDALHQCRRRVQQQLTGHRGRSGDPLYSCRRTLHTGIGLLTDRQWGRISRLFDTDDHVEIEVT
jgi:transposase